MTQTFTITKGAKQNQQWTTQREEGCLWKDRKQCGWFTHNIDHPYGIAMDDTEMTLPRMYIICHNTSGAAAYTLRAASVHHSVHPLSPEQKQTLHIINYGPLHSDSSSRTHIANTKAYLNYFYLMTTHKNTSHESSVKVTL
jgi:hypothetical protein